MIALLVDVNAVGRVDAPGRRRLRVDENRFWSMIEAAWGTVGGKTKSRQRLAEGKLSDDRAYALQETLEVEVTPAAVIGGDAALEIARGME